MVIVHDEMCILNKVTRLQHAIIAASTSAETLLPMVSKVRTSLEEVSSSTDLMKSDFEDAFSYLKQLENDLREEVELDVLIDEIVAPSISFNVHAGLELNDRLRMVEWANAVVDSFIANFGQLVREDSLKYPVMFRAIDMAVDDIYSMLKMKANFVKTEDIVNLSKFEDIVTRIFGRNDSALLKTSAIFSK